MANGRKTWWGAALLLALASAAHQPQAAQPPAAQPPADKPAAGAEADPLPPRALKRFGTPRLRHGSRIQALAFAEGSRLAAAGGNDPIRVWDSATGKELQQLPEPWINALAFTRRGGELVTGGSLKIVRIWDLRDNKEAAQLTGHTAAVTAVAVSTDNTLLASASADGTVILWEKGFKNITMVAQFKGHADAVTTLAFSPDLDSDYLVSGSTDRSVRVWSVNQKKMLHQLDARGAVSAVTFVDDKTVAAAGDDGAIRLWTVADGKEGAVLKGHQGAVLSLAANPDGKTLVSSGEDATLRVWDLAQGKERLKIARHAGDGDALSLSRDGQWVACGGANHTIRVFDTKTGKERVSAPGLQAGLASLALAPDGKTFATVTNTGTLTVWDRQTAQALRTWDTVQQGEIVLAYTPDGALLASAARNHPIRVWDPNTGKESFQLPAKQGDLVLSIAFAPQGGLLAAGYRSGAADIWNWKDKRIAQQAKLASLGGVQAVAFATDGSVVGLGGVGKVALWDVAAGKEIRVLDSKEGVNVASLPAVAALAFSSDGKTLAIGCYDGAIRLVDRVKGKEMRSLEGHGSVPYSIAFSADGRILASGSFDKTVRIWEAFSGLTIASLTGHQGPVHAVALTRDGRSVFSASADTTALCWDVTGRARDGFDSGKAATVDFETAWRDLASEDTSRGHRALWDLVVHGQTGVPYLKKQLYLIDPKHIDQMFRDLGDKSFNVRKNATTELERYGRWMEGRFKEALVSPADLEVQRRIEQMLAKLTGGFSLEQERIRVRRVMLIMEQVDTPTSREVLQSLVVGAPEVDLQAEARISLERLGKR